MRICYTWVAEDDASDQTKERSTCLAQGNQGQRGQVEILQGALKKAHMKNKQTKKTAWNNCQSRQKQSQLRRDQRHSFPLPFPTPPYVQTLEPAGQWAGGLEKRRYPSPCLLSPLEASSLGKWWSAAFKSSSEFSLLSWIGHWFVNQDCLQLSITVRATCYLRKSRKVSILGQGTFNPSKQSSMGDVGDQ